MLLKKSQVALIVTATLLSACSSDKGGFGLDTTQSVVPKYVPKKAKPIEYGDDITAEKSYEKLPELLQPSLGYEVMIPRRATGLAGTKLEERLDISPGKVRAINGSIHTLPHEEEIKNDAGAKSSGEPLIHSHDGKRESRKRDMQFVRSGWVMIEGGLARESDAVRFGNVGYVYYKGENPSKSLPVGQTVNYVGTWDFTTNAVNKRTAKGFEASQLGDRYGATSFNKTANEDPKKGAVGHSSEFSVDFGKKELTGGLFFNQPAYRDDEVSKKEKLYDVSAKLYGNRFRGSATAANKQEPYFGADAKNTLEGGFYGPNAEELAGKFLASDQSLFAVFAAKQAEGKAATETKFDARRISLGDLQQAEMDTFGQAVQLVVDGKVISLLSPNTEHKIANKSVKVTACCNNLADTKFGLYKIDNQAEQLFLTGERTAVNAIPKTGGFEYKGSWQGQLVSQDGSVKWSPSEERTARLYVDFAQKTMQGGFGDGTKNPTVLLFNDGKIDQNGFSGVVKTVAAGFNANGKTLHIDAKASGAFYGANAQELGGSFINNTNSQDKAAGVFGLKRQIEKK
ncbi:transferrin-binding protein-like solute binding protein [Actinobacillus equuli subsp. haemolyticus]|uniref:transferrin-binding protein-like solute binding protein n=2 Tax=Actinobacillus equuli TaxID=718 RepID=UPI0024466018|nr:transferrin-binding protein-like solute binding protein [Actinobacillus equuli]WGE73645.1 transferrin-binding protein-like solute binding protein [Actinobacillus equuli subsp. haemolyticus]